MIKTKKATSKQRAMRAAQSLVGKRITAIRNLSAAEAKALGYTYRPPVIELDDGSVIYPCPDTDKTPAW